MNKKILLLPLALFVVLLVFLALGLTRDPREVPSPLVGKAAPAFTAARLDAPEQTFSASQMRGKVWLLNVWASWCVSCRAEHPVLLELAKTRALPLIGLNYKDQRADALGWLQRFGDPYQLSAFDLDGRIGIDYGVYGVPETYLIDQAGVIRHKVIGPLTPEILSGKILPLLKELQS